jgi:LAO/AO transport system kinase
MKDLSGDAGIFIRSMASRGALGGLARTTAAAAHVFDAAGYGIVLIETVGAGQGEVDIARLAHTTLVVEAPGMGDEIQAIKAGIIEIADVFVVNKADRPGVEHTERALRSMLELGHPAQRMYSHHGASMAIAVAEEVESPLWMPPIQRTVATEGTGVPELVTHIGNHAKFLRESGAWLARERLRLQGELESLVQQGLMSQFRNRISDRKYAQVLDQVVAHSLSPWDAVELLVNGKKP